TRGRLSPIEHLGEPFEGRTKITASFSRSDQHPVIQRQSGLPSAGERQRFAAVYLSEELGREPRPSPASGRCQHLQGTVERHTGSDKRRQLPREKRQLAGTEPWPQTKEVG